MSEQTATDRLRELLDELRKLACDVNESEIRSHSVINIGHGKHSKMYELMMNPDWLNAWHAEFDRLIQAIEATLGLDGEQATERFCSESDADYELRQANRGE